MSVSLSRVVPRRRSAMRSDASWLSLALVPPVVVVLLIGRYSVDVPFWDQWELVPLLERYYTGTLSIRDLWAQHNEHRLLFPRLLMLALALATRWSIHAELALNVALAATLFATIIWQLDRTAAARPRVRPVRLLPLLSLLVWSVGQWENWLWGWQIQIFLNVAAVAGASVLLSLPLTWPRVLGAAVLGVIASYSFANGLLVWPIGAALVLVAPAGARDARRWQLTAWAVLATLTVGSYLHGYTKPTNLPPLMNLLRQPLEFAHYGLMYLGAPLAGRNRPLALLCGFVGIVLFGVLLGGLYRRHRPLVLPYAGWALYALGSALLTASGRAGLGLDQALESRYTTIATLLWVATVILAAVAVHAWGGRRRWLRLVALSSMLLLVALLAINALFHLNAWQRHAEHLRPARVAVRAAAPDALVRRVYPNLAVTKERIGVLRTYRLSVFADE